MRNYKILKIFSVRYCFIKSILTFSPGAISLGDIEHNPSAPDALLTAIVENREWIFENGVLVEKDLSENVENYQDALKKASKNQISDVVKNILFDYMKQLK